MNKKALIAIILIVALGGTYWATWKDAKSSSGNATLTNQATAPQFRKDAELTFASATADSAIVKIDIEVADEEWEISQGLMYRPEMASNAGMLFVFRDIRPRSFWMKNTIISLDILFVDSQKNIVTIQKYTTPYSEDSVPSYKDAQYVIEVNAGFCDQYGIKEGDRVEFDLEG